MEIDRKNDGIPLGLWGHCFVRACTVEMHMDFTRAFCAKIYRKNAGRQSLGHRFVGACAIEMHMGMSQEPFCLEICRELAGHG